MKFSSLCALLSISISLSSAWALPQDFGIGNFLQGGMAMDGRDLTPGFMAPEAWNGSQELDGSWRDAYENGPRRVRHIKAAPYLFGQVPIGVEAVYLGKALERISIYYLGSGTFFGYAPGLKDSAAGQATLKQKQRQFRKIFTNLEKSLSSNIEDLTGDRGKSASEGTTSLFKQRFHQYEKDGLAVQLRTAKDFYVRVDLRRRETVRESLLSPEHESVRKRERLKRLKGNVKQVATGDVQVDGVPMIYQGGRAYCGITTFLMGAQYLGIQVDPATLASVAGFRYGQGGKKMIEAYNAVAREGGMRLKRATKIDIERVQASVDAGLPVLVWRHYDKGRNQLHMRATGRAGALPEPDDSDKARWPGVGSPAHASVITGYNRQTNEVIFDESWGEHARGKRMRAEELEATSYYVFYFSV